MPRITIPLCQTRIPTIAHLCDTPRQKKTYLVRRAISHNLRTMFFFVNFPTTNALALEKQKLLQTRHVCSSCPLSINTSHFFRWKVKSGHCNSHTGWSYQHLLHQLPLERSHNLLPSFWFWTKIVSFLIDLLDFVVKKGCISTSNITKKVDCLYSTQNSEKYNKSFFHISDGRL